MNARDIEAARRLIAQFEDRALGRHNSGQFHHRRSASGIDYGPASSIMFYRDGMEAAIEALKRATVKMESASDAFTRLGKVLRPKIQIPFKGSIYSRSDFLIEVRE